jgi:tol-pal system protein YbgF
VLELRTTTENRVSPAWLLVLIIGITTGAVGCHDHSALEKQLADLRKELVQVRTVQGNNSVVLEDMDNRLLLLHDQVDSNRLMLGSTAPPSALPVVRLQPNAAIYPTEGAYAVDPAVAPYPYPEPALRVEPVAPIPATVARPEPAPPAPAPTGAIQFQMLDEYGNVVASGDGAADLDAVAPAAPVEAAPTKTAAATKSDDTRALGLYKKGMALLTEKRHREAVAMFEDFLSQFPQHGYADNCTYWIGEAYYDRQMYHKALAHFEQVVVQYPRGNKVPDAMLKAAFCYSSLGLRDRCAELFEKLIRTFPGTPAARLAEKRKAELL